MTIVHASAVVDLAGGGGRVAVGQSSGLRARGRKWLAGSGCFQRSCRVRLGDPYEECERGWPRRHRSAALDRPPR